MMGFISLIGLGKDFVMEGIARMLTLGWVGNAIIDGLVMDSGRLIANGVLSTAILCIC